MSLMQIINGAPPVVLEKTTIKTELRHVLSFVPQFLCHVS